MSNATPSSVSAPRTDIARRWPALWAALLGLVILCAAGFAPQEFHNAAHDARHSFALPCH